MAIRKSSLLAGLILFEATALLAIIVDTAYLSAASRTQRQERRDLVRRLQLTDLVLFTDARYTRHPAMADFHSPFQDAPNSMDHFPSGSLVVPPRHVRVNERLP